MVRVADDARVILGTAPVVTELELFQAENLGPESATEPIQRAATDTAKAKDDGYVVPLHGASSRLPSRF